MDGISLPSDRGLGTTMRIREGLVVEEEEEEEEGMMTLL